MAIIRMKGVKIKNLDQLREHFDFTNAKDYLLQGTLSAWMREQGETELADELNELKDQNYSDQTMADNFVGIFGLEQTISVAETTAEIVAVEKSGSLPVKTDEISVGNLSFAPSSCFGETGIVYLDEEKLARYGLEESDGKIDDIRRFAKNRLALYIVFKIANTVMHLDFVKQNKCQWTLELDTRFCDIGWQYKHFRQLKKRLDDLFLYSPSVRFEDTHETFLLACSVEKNKRIITIRNLLDLIGQSGVRFGYKYDPDYDGKFTHILCNGRYEELSREYKI